MKLQKKYVQALSVGQGIPICQEVHSHFINMNIEMVS